MILVAAQDNGYTDYRTVPVALSIVPSLIIAILSVRFLHETTETRRRVYYYRAPLITTKLTVLEKLEISKTERSQSEKSTKTRSH